MNLINLDGTAAATVIQNNPGNTAWILLLLIVLIGIVCVLWIRSMLAKRDTTAALKGRLAESDELLTASKELVESLKKQLAESDTALQACEAGKKKVENERDTLTIQLDRRNAKFHRKFAEEQHEAMMAQLESILQTLLEPTPEDEESDDSEQLTLPNVP